MTGRARQRGEQVDLAAAADGDLNQVGHRLTGDEVEIRRRRPRHPRRIDRQIPGRGRPGHCNVQDHRRNAGARHVPLTRDLDGAGLTTVDWLRWTADAAAGIENAGGRQRVVVAALDWRDGVRRLRRWAGAVAVGCRHNEGVGRAIVEPANDPIRRGRRPADGGRGLRHRPKVGGDLVAGQRTDTRVRWHRPGQRCRSITRDSAHIQRCTGDIRDYGRRQLDSRGVRRAIDRHRKGAREVADCRWVEADVDCAAGSRLQ